MAIHLLPGKFNEENVGVYAGLLSSAALLGRGLGENRWRRVADLYGRVTSLTVSLLLTSLLSLAFGLSGSYWVALTWRFLLGLANGILPIVKTTVSEIARGDKVLEDRGMVRSAWTRDKDGIRSSYVLFLEFSFEFHFRRQGRVMSMWGAYTHLHI